jgi:hypothetical protein
VGFGTNISEKHAAYMYLPFTLKDEGSKFFKYVGTPVPEGTASLREYRKINMHSHDILIFHICGLVTSKI